MEEFGGENALHFAIQTDCDDDICLEIVKKLLEEDFDQ